jgi:hypothetical protein
MASSFGTGPYLSAGEAHVLLVDDVRGSGLDAKGKPAVMTDGNGLISINLAATFPCVSSGQRVSDAGGAPLVTQFRNWIYGSMDKGTVTTDARLPDGYIIMRQSMRKVHGSQHCIAQQHGINRFEINNTSEMSRRGGRLNVNLVQILEHCAKDRQRMKAYLLERQKEEAKRVCMLSDGSASREERKSVLGCAAQQLELLCASLWHTHLVAALC